MKLRGPLVSLLLVGCMSGTPPSPTPVGSAGASLSQRPQQSAASTPQVTPEPSFTESDLADRIRPRAMLKHLEELQEIADGHGGNRATGTPGFDASVRYVSRALADAGYRVGIHVVEVGDTTSVNVVGEVTGRAEGVIMLGAHLDSVVAGPGINDNGSGVAALLELARAFRQLPPPPRTVRFAFWGAEEGGPFGSAAYASELTRSDREAIVAYLNFDMLASPNAVAFVYDEAEAAPGSAAITALFVREMESAGLAWDPIDLEGDSDHGPFTEEGIPTGGLFSGGIEPVTDAQAARHGAIAGVPADPCSHRPCDTIDNVDLGILSRLTDVIARTAGRIALDGLDL
jgi:aminopeptidase S